MVRYANTSEFGAFLNDLMVFEAEKKMVFADLFVHKFHCKCGILLIIAMWTDSQHVCDILVY